LQQSVVRLLSCSNNVFHAHGAGFKQPAEFNTNSDRSDTVAAIKWQVCEWIGDELVLIWKT
jgi:hypothetical protein